MKKPKVSLIAAVAASDRAIGKDNKLLWHIPADFAHFKKVTEGYPVIMGKKTFESLPQGALPGRTNIVLSLDKEEIPGCTVANSIERAIEIAGQESDEVFIIGGGSVYAQTIGKADKLYLTLVEGDFEADTYFPDYSDFTKIVSEKGEETDGYKYKFVELEKE